MVETSTAILTLGLRAMVELLLAMPAAVAAEVTVALVVTVLLRDTAATVETGGLGTGSSGLLTTGTSEPRQQHTQGESNNLLPLVIISIV